MTAAVADLAARGVHDGQPGSPDGSGDLWTTWVTDPDGYRIELVQWPAGHAEGMTAADVSEPDAELLARVPWSARASWPRPVYWRDDARADGPGLPGSAGAAR